MDSITSLYLTQQVSIMPFLRINAYVFFNMYEDFACTKALYENDSLELLMELHEIGCPITSSVCMECAKIGNLKCLQYACKKCDELNSYLFVEVALYGHLECLKYLYEESENGNIYPADDQVVCIAAAMRGHLHCLKYLYENGHQWNESIYTICKEYEQSECLKFVMEHKC